MTNIIQCNTCDQEVVKDNSIHICNACQVNRDPKAWKAKSKSALCCEGNEYD